MIFHENLPAGQTTLMKFHALKYFVIFLKSSKILNCRLLQIIDGTLWIRIPLRNAQVLLL